MPPAKIDPLELRDLIEVQKLQQWKAAEMLGVSTSCVERTCKRLGLSTQRTGPRSGHLHPDWKGGRTIVGGYVYIWTGDHPMATKAGYVAEHRLAMAAKIGRFLRPDEVVHHIDRDKQNNDPANLMLFPTNAEHLKHELTGQTPNHSPEGKERMRQAGIRTQNRLRLERDAAKRNQGADHQKRTTEP